MKLSQEDVELFYRLFHSLLVYVNKNLKIVNGINSLEDFKKFSPEEVNKIREKLYQHPDLIDSFVNENPVGFSSDELKIISSWKNFVQKKLYIFRYLKNYTVFLDPEKPPKAYGVLALSSSFEEMIGPYLPVLVNVVLLPFKGKITYDSMYLRYNITFGSGFRRDLDDVYQEAKAKLGIITSLPFSAERTEQSDTEKLRFYLRSESSRRKYWSEIWDLIGKDPNLLVLYHQEMGKIDARRYMKPLRAIGLANVWFAIFEGIIIASGTTRDEVQRILQSVLPNEKLKFVYIFQLKERWNFPMYYLTHHKCGALPDFRKHKFR